MAVRFLNLGCGCTFRPGPEWLNLDVAPAPRTPVGQYQLALGIPLPDASFDGVYHSHMLEHLEREQVLPFLRECLRVLRPGGVLRVAVPDLARIARAYVAVLDEIQKGSPAPDLPPAEERLEWLQIELIDQIARRRSTGRMGEFWRHASPEMTAWIRSRSGGELDDIPQSDQPAPEAPLRLPVLDPAFLLSGENHRWMYDVPSLARLMRQAGFCDVTEKSHTESAFLHGDDLQLDQTPDGSCRKPDSVFVEARRPKADASESSAEAAVSGIRPVIFSTTDYGGAAIAGLRLHDGLRAIGVPSLAYVQHKRGEGRQVYVLPPTGGDRMLPDGDGGAVLASRGAVLRDQAQALARHPGRPQGCESFTHLSAQSSLAAVPLLDQASLLHFHWIAGFIDIPANLPFLAGKPLVWTLHDMNPFTGGCHYADGCRRFLESCGACPQLGSDKENDITRSTWQQRRRAYEKLNLHVVCPSRWLADEARASSLFGGFPVHVIPYGLPLDIFTPYPKGPVREALGLSPSTRAFLFSADNVVNRRKGLAWLVAALNLLKQQRPAEDVTLLLLGSGGDMVQGLPFPVKALGRLDDMRHMAAVYSAADALILPTLEDNLPNVVLEAMACGTPTVGFNVGGMPDMIEHQVNGFLAAPRDAASLAQGLVWALQMSPHVPRLCRALAMERYPLERQARRYVGLYEEILAAHPAPSRG